MLKYRVAIWLAIVLVGQLCAVYIKAAAGIQWGTSECGQLFGGMLALSAFSGVMAAFIMLDDRDLEKAIGVRK